MCNSEIAWSLKIYLICLFLLLPGCGTKQTQEQDNLVFTGTHKHDPALSPSEVRAFHSRGQVDKNIPNHALNDIASQYKYYLGKGRAAVCQVAQRSGHHLEYAKKVFKSRGMPEELANLAIVESGYRTNVVSKAGAAGAWQFIPETGQKFGLIQDIWQDDRLDPYKSTEAAADYLQYLYNHFGDWPTAIAAYNAGEGKMARAKTGTGSKDFFEVTARNEMLDEKAQLREETKNYVPRFIAVTKIMRNLPQLGFDAVEIDETNQVSRLQVAPGTDLTALSSACALPWKDFTVYNQHHKRPITCTSRETFVYVPNRAQRQAAQYLAAHGKGEFAGWKLVAVKKNSDTLEKLGKQTKVPLEKLRKANPGVNRLKSGQLVLVPPTLNLPAATSTAANSVAQKKQAISLSKSGRQHQVAANETLYAIARKYNLDAKTLQHHNSIKDPAQLKVGGILQIPGADKITKTAEFARSSAKKQYVVQPKDNLWSISRKFNVSVDDIKRWNKLDNQPLKPGVTLALSAN